MKLLTLIYSVFFAFPIAVTAKTPKVEVTCDTYWNFYKKLKIWTCFPQNGRFRDQTGGRETTSQNRSLPFKTGGLEHMGSTVVVTCYGTYLILVCLILSLCHGQYYSIFPNFAFQH